MNTNKLVATLVASPTDPGVRPTWDALPPGVKDFLTDVVGTIVSIGLLIAVAALVGGLIMWGVAAATGRPGVATVGVTVVVIAAVVAVLCGGASGFIAWFAGQGVGIFSS